MRWHAYRLVCRLDSPLHAGWRSVGNLMQTRPYVTGRNWWGAATAHLTGWIGQYAYAAVGEFVRDNLVFGYLFPAESPDLPLVPRWGDDGLRYGPLNEKEFERRFLSSVASTAIDYEHNVASEGQLHEVEFLSQRTASGDVLLIGYLLAREVPAQQYGHVTFSVRCTPNEVYVNELPLFTRVLARVQLGGERRYGFGRIHIRQVAPANDLFGHPLVSLDEDAPVVRVDAERPLPAHAQISGLRASGEIEPLLGREWHESDGPGRRLSNPVLCWSPGAVACSQTRLRVGPMGVWAVVE